MAKLRSADTTRLRRQIAAKVREQRHSRGWTQVELSNRLGLSQNRLSEIERGAGSFTAEQFVLLMKLFNITVNELTGDKPDHVADLQNALVRLGAVHLRTIAAGFPSEQLHELNRVVREALVDGSPRIVTGLAPVLVRHATRFNLARLHSELVDLGIERRLPWVVDNTLAAIDKLWRRSDSISKEQEKLFRHAEVALRFYLEHVVKRDRSSDPEALAPDVLDATIRSEQTLAEVRRTRSRISQQWGVVTSIQPDDFVQALRAAGAAP